MKVWLGIMKSGPPRLLLHEPPAEEKAKGDWSLCEIEETTEPQVATKDSELGVLIESFTIFAQYDVNGTTYVYGQADAVIVELYNEYGQMPKVNEEDTKRLFELGWKHPDTTSSRWEWEGMP